MSIRIFELAQELGLPPDSVQQWLEQHGDPRHTDPFALLDDRLAAGIRGEIARAPAANTTVTGFQGSQED